MFLLHLDTQIMSFFVENHCRLCFRLETSKFVFTAEKSRGIHKHVYVGSHGIRKHVHVGCFSQWALFHPKNKAPVLFITETGWDLGPGTLCCSACTWTNVSSSNKIQRNYEGLKVTVCTHSWGNLWATGYKKTKNPAATSEEPGAKLGYYA